MSTLERTINILNTLPVREIETIYEFVQFISLKQDKQTKGEKRPAKEVLADLVGVLPDSGKSLEEYRNERLQEKYEMPIYLPIR